MADKDDNPQLPDDGLDDEAGSGASGSRDASWLSSEFLAGISKRHQQLFGELQSSAISNLMAGLTPLTIPSILPQIKDINLLPQLNMPMPGIDIPALNIGKGLAEVIQRQYLDTVAPFAEYLAQQRQQWDSLFESLRKITEGFLPPNWKGVEHPDYDAIETILVDEGLPLAWIPRREVLQGLFDAPDAQARRKIIGRRWRTVVSDCEVVLSEVNHPALQCHRPFATDVVNALRDGHVSAAQALAANLLDSILRRNFDKDDFKDVTTNKKNGSRFDIDDYQIKAAFTLGPVWRAYAEYWQSQGDPIPRAFGRHPSAHAVSRTQYSRINAVIALMIVTSLLRLLEFELAR
jgi:hypothetical protein